MGPVYRHPLLPIRRWLNTPPNLAKFTLGFLAVMQATFAVNMFLITDVVYRYIWPVWFGLAAASCLVACISFTQSHASIAGAATVTAFLGRGIAVIITWVTGHYVDPDPPRLIIGVCTYATLAFMSSLLFFRGLLQVAGKLDRGEEL